jgi:hypothetical protein
MGMRDQIVSYIKVLKERRRVFDEYLTECEKSANREDAIQYSGIIEAVDNIIAELEGFVKSQFDVETARWAFPKENEENFTLTGRKNEDDAVEATYIMQKVDITEESTLLGGKNEDKKTLLDRIAGEGNYAMDDDGNYDVEASGGPPDPTQKREG